MYNYVYFYSNIDKYSLYLLQKIYNSSNSSLFNFFCIDGIKNLPKYVQFVPSLKVYISDTEFKILIGTQIEEFIEEDEEEQIPTYLSEADKLRNQIVNPKVKKINFDEQFECASEIKQGKLDDKFEKDLEPSNDLLPSGTMAFGEEENDYDDIKPMNSNDYLPDNINMEDLMKQKQREREQFDKELKIAGEMTQKQLANKKR